jgi:hypothetical protein
MGELKPKKIRKYHHHTSDTRMEPSWASKEETTAGSWDKRVSKMKPTRITDFVILILEESPKITGRLGGNSVI